MVVLVGSLATLKGREEVDQTHKEGDMILLKCCVDSVAWFFCDMSSVLHVLFTGFCRFLDFSMRSIMCNNGSVHFPRFLVSIE